MTAVRDARSALVVLALAFTALLATGRANAEAIECTGVNMLPVLESDPAIAEKLKAQAAETVNGKGLLWKIEKEGATPSFLFGTMHVTDPRVTSLTPAARSAFEAAETVVIETTEVMDQTKMLAALMQRPELTMFIDERSLESLLTAEDASVLNKALEARGISPASVSKMKPWMLSATLALPACELARKADGAAVLDVKLAQDAVTAGKNLEGLETIVAQLEAMASLPMEFHMKGLIDTAKLGDRIDDLIETMIVLYQNENTGMFWPLFRAAMPGGEAKDSGYAAFEQAMVITRNRKMVEKAAPILEGGGAFIAIGALHLPGQDGLVELFRREGYDVSRIN